ncbi:MAG: hypothetical protein VYD64_03190 [Pseudomonadota bacterium]|nr:hypothetical protein [Pseudomonadota bacterium]
MPPILLPGLLSGLLLLAVALYYFQVLPVGGLSHGDEYLTLERSHSFVVRDDPLTVYSENRPTFKKPPLQYWIGAWLIGATGDLVFALRTPSYLFALALLAATGALALVLNPTRPYAAPAAIALLAGSARFWENAMSALLDMGAAFFATVAVAACLMALRRPRGWYLVAVATAIAAWQKAPIPLLMVAGMLVVVAATRRLHDIDLRTSLANRHFLIAAIVMAAGVLAWPLIQYLKYGASSLEQAYVSQMVDRFSPFADSGTDKHRSWYTVLLDSEALLRVPALLAIFAMPWVLRRRELVALPALLVVFAVMAAFASGYVSPRYSLVFLPMLMASLAVVTLEIVPNRLAALAVILVLSMTSLGPFKSANALGIADDDQARYVPFLRSIAASLEADETLVTCNGRAAEGRIHRGAITYYASAGRPFERIRSADELAHLEDAGAVSPPYRGLCSEGDFEELRAVRPGLQTVERFGGYVHWKSTPPAPQ